MTLGFEDLSIFFNIKEFGQEILKGDVGSEVTIDAIFDSKSIMIDETYAETEISQPKITVRTSDIAEVREGHRFVVLGQAYNCLEPVHDGTGVSTLRLKKKR